MNVSTTSAMTLLLAGITGLVGVAVVAQENGATGLSRGLVRTTLDRATGRLDAQVTVHAANSGLAPVLAPLHVTGTIVSGAVQRVAMPGSLGGPGLPPYGTFYFDLSAQTTGGVLGSGLIVGESLRFTWPKRDRIGYALGLFTGQRGSVSRPPTLNVQPQPPHVVTEGDEVRLAIAGEDPDGDAVTLAVATPLANAAFSPTNGAPATASFRFAAVPGQRGFHAATFQATDPGGLQAEQSVLIEVRPLNRPPTLTVAPTAEVKEGGVLSLPLVATDPDGDAVTLEVSPPPPHSLLLSASGVFLFGPADGQAGVYDLTFTASDGHLTATAQMRITVTDVSGSDPAGGLVLTVLPVESPTLHTQVRVAGSVNAAPPALDSALRSGVITGMSPASLRAGESAEVTLTGAVAGDFATHFQSGVSVADFGPGVAVGVANVASASALTVRVTVAPGAAPGPRQVRVGTGAGTAFAVMAFLVEPARTTVTGRLLDSVTGLPLAGVRVALEGTGFTATTLADGTFTLSDVPAGAGTLLALPPDHGVVRTALNLEPGVPQDLGDVVSAPTVHDPAQPEGISLHSVLGRGFGDPRGTLTLEDARALIRDALLLIGGDEVGVLDAQGGQLNPDVVDDGLMSVNDRGIDLLAGKLVRGDTVRLLDVVFDLSMGLTWAGGGSPPFAAWQAALQAAVDEAWSNPEDPGHQALLLAFNNGQGLSPNPPLLTGDTRLARAQAFLMVSGVLNAVYKNRADWIPPAASPGAPAGQALRPAAAPPRIDGSYTQPWIALLADMGENPKGYAFSSMAGANKDLPGFERVLSRYYLDASAASLTEAATILKDNFGDQAFVDSLFARDPFSTRRVMTNLLAAAAVDVDVRTRFGGLTSPAGAGGAPKLNLWSAMSIGRGPAVHYPLSLLPQDLALWPMILTRSLAPSSPQIYQAVEKRTAIGPEADPILIPSVEIVFFPSGDDEWPQTNPDGVFFLYRLWRMEEAAGGSGQRLVLVRAGQIQKYFTDALAPHEDGNTTDRKVVFVDPFPEPGMAQYRIDCIRGDRALIDNWKTNSTFVAAVEPWFAGYLGEGDQRLAALDDQNAFGNVGLHPGQAFLNEKQYHYSALSNPAAVNVTGAGSGFSPFGRVDLGARYESTDFAYVSIPAFAPRDRGTGAVFTFHLADGSMGASYLNPGFMTPGQIGLAVDDKGNVFSENAATEAAYGGKLFRWTADAGTGALSGRMHIGQVNYYSQLLQRPNPVSLRSMRIGPWNAAGNGQVLYLADALSHEVKRIDAGVIPNYTGGQTDAAWHVVGQRWAWNTGAVVTTPLAFGADTDMALSFDRRRLYVTQSRQVVRTTEGADKAEAVTTGSPLFTAAAGCDMCERRGREILFVADRATGRILRIPIDDLPLDVPSDPFEFEAVLAKYTAFAGLAHPTALRVVENGRGLLYADDDGVHYERFGFSGRAEDPQGNALAGAHVTLQSASGVQSSTTDREGTYYFRGDLTARDAILHVNHPQYSYTERITVDFNCGSEIRPEPLVMVTNVFGVAVNAGHQDFETTAATVTISGDILPTPVQFHQTGALLEITRPDGALDQVDLTFTGDGNQWVVANVPLMKGETGFIVRVNASGVYLPGSSERFRIRRR